MNKIFLLLVVWGFVACNKSENPFSMSSSDLTNTYWKESARYYYNYEDGKYHTDGNVLNGFDGAGGPSVLYFATEKIVTEYVILGATGGAVSHYFRTGTFDWDWQKKQVQTDLIKEFGISTSILVERFTSSMIVLSYSDGDENLLKVRHTFVPFNPTDEWKRKAAQYPNYDDIDWSNPR